MGLLQLILKPEIPKNTLDVLISVGFLKSDCDFSFYKLDKQVNKLLSS